MVVTSSSNPSLFCAAVIATAHGVLGHVKVKCFLEDPSQFKSYSPYTDEKGKETFEVDRVYSRKDDVLIVSLKGLQDRNQAEHLRGQQLMMPYERLPKLDDDTFYHKDLIGIDVLSHKGDKLGQVHALHNYGAGDLLEVTLPDGKLVMIPFTKSSVPVIDLQKGCIQLSEEGEEYIQGGPYVS
jgi:16S rRNA processing protein RimM